GSIATTTPPMKAILWTVAFALSTSLSHAAEAPPQQPPPTDYSIVQRGPHHRTHQRTTYQTGLGGRIVPRTNSYEEIATGICHQNGNGEWVDSSTQISILPEGGAAATNGLHQLYAPGDLYSDVIELTLPDSRKLVSRPLGLSYFDGENSLLVAQLTPGSV